MQHKKFFYWDPSAISHLEDLCNILILAVSEVSIKTAYVEWLKYVNKLSMAYYNRDILAYFFYQFTSTV